MENTENRAVQEEAVMTDNDVVKMNLDGIQSVIRSKGNWFFWVAALSVVNTLLASNGTFFIIGLAVSQFVDAMAIQLTGSVNYFLSLLAPLVFAAFGYFTYKLHRWAFIVGGVLYLFDGLLYVAFEEYLAAGFHVYVLYNLYQGFKFITEYEEEHSKLGPL
jgi:hypothetical protein